MGGQQDAPALLADVLDPPPELAARLGIEARRRLVEQQQQRLVDDGDVERQSLLLAAGELLERLGRLGLEADGAEVVGDLTRPRCCTPYSPAYSLTIWLIVSSD